MAGRARQQTENTAEASADKSAKPRSKKVSRNPQRTQETILDAATEEFAAHGFGGARLDAFAARAQTN